MKKYKHKISGYEVTQTKEGFYNSEKYGLVHKELIELSSDWKEIIEKDYKILTLIGNKNNENYKNIIIKCEGANKKEPNDHWDINSVQRLCDLEVFTVGDNVENFNFKGYKIENIDLSDNTIFFRCKIDDHTTFHISLKEAKRYKTPLFTTQDGVDIYEDYNGVIHNVCNLGSFEYVPTNFKSYTSILNKDFDYYTKNKNWLFFSTKEKAQEYIDLNKPKYSFNDICGAIDQSCHLGPNYEKFIKKLEELNRK